MANSQLEDMQELLRKAKILPEIIEPEKSIFSIGGRGHWENPTTEILAFFCDNNAVHGLGDLVLKSLIQCLDTKDHDLDLSLNKTPEREVWTPSGKRIDLLLESEHWVLVLENKIFHVQNNPFKEYEDFIEKDNHCFKENKKMALFVVLSPDGKVTGASEKWKGISYESLIRSIKQHLSEYFINHPLNKWVILLREFILHLEGLLMSQSNTVENENIEFVLKNIDSIKELQDLKTLAINQWHESLRAQLESRMGNNIKINLQHWDGLPALRFSCESWIENDSDVVLFLSGNNNEHYIKYFALIDPRDEDIMKNTDDALFEDCSDAPWMEGMYRAYQCKYYTFNNVVDELHKKLKLLDNFFCKKTL
ncbi:PD-(D/E)XK nuclease family protein [uncultured Psychromonas sp.]|uniref:PDDEXK-like family protein n=1 Tax=uncultured Psychromonas sp. TaxID=173974 RepID=UPI00261CF4B7|nr:PD-(D/E)XK nuclease family protein [uncultured Psychromonas sp.]